MGATLSSRVEWTSASDKGGKLDFSKTNENILREIVKYVDSLCSNNPREAQVIFKHPFVWKSALSLSSFETLRTGEHEFSDSGMQSVNKTDSGDPHLNISKAGDVCEVRALNFKQLQKVLICARDKKMSEARLCLEANQDPITTIMGPGFASSAGVPGGSSTLLNVHERLAREKMVGREGQGMDELDSSFRLLLLLISLDLTLLHSSVQELGKETRLSPGSIEAEVTLLKQFSGESKDMSCLKEIIFTSEMVFSNGCRAPPWRQVFGDICYLKILPCDTAQLFVTASTEGYYVNKGLKTSGEVDPETAGGKVFPTLVTLLKTSSPHFSSSIGKQEHTFIEETDSGNVTSVEGEGGGGEVGGEEVTLHNISEDQEQKSSGSKRPDTQNTKKTPGSQQKKRIPKSSFLQQQPVVPGSLEPSQKWKSLGASDTLYMTAPDTLSKPVSRKTTSIVTPPNMKTKSATSIKTKSNVGRGSVVGSVGDLDVSESSSEASEEEEQQDRRPESNADLPTEYWQIQKLIKYLKGGNQTATVISLCALMDFDLGHEACQLSLRDSGGLDLLINLLETEEPRSMVGALKILRDISRNSVTRTAIVDLGGIPMLVHILQSQNRELKSLAAETIANLAKFKRARRIVRQTGGIKKLVSLFSSPGRPNTPVTGERTDLEVARCAALALWSCSKSKSNKTALLRTGAVPHLSKLLETDHVDVLIPIVGTLQECASERAYQELIRSEGMIEHLVRGLKMEDQELQKHCASAIFKCAEEETTRSLVREHEGLPSLAELLKVRDNQDLLCAATGAVWKCSKSPENVAKFKTMKVVEQLVSLLNNQPEEVLVNVVGALGECAAGDGDNRVALRKAGGVIPLVQLLTGTNQDLLINTTKAVGACARDNDSMTVIDRQDGVRLLWSLLKSPNLEVQACAAWAICPCIENAKDAGELVRSFVGGLELIVGLLKSPDKEVLASVCAAIAKIAKDEENLGVITDHGVVPLLAKLTDTTDDHLRKHLADAIARCCMWRNNREAFGQELAVAPLVTYLYSPDPLVHRATACALNQLSKDPDNCITMHEAGVVQPLLQMVGSSDEVLQEAAAGCISNIRHLALANEKAKFK